MVVQVNIYFEDIIALFSRYDSTTGTFTVPPGGDGFYYFSVFLTALGGKSVYFNVDHNGEEISTVYSDLTSSPSSDHEMASCSAIIYAVEGTSDFSKKCIQKRKQTFH